jgi:hypothetical protein
MIVLFNRGKCSARASGISFVPFRRPAMGLATRAFSQLQECDKHCGCAYQ